MLALRYSKMICQGRRNDIVEELKRLENPDEIRENGTCGSDFHNSKSREALGAEYNLTGRSVATYLRINELSEALKIRIDNGEFAIAVVVGIVLLLTGGADDKTSAENMGGESYAVVLDE